MAKSKRKPAIDLSEFLTPEAREQLSLTNALGKAPTGLVLCTQCQGEGTYLHQEMVTPGYTEEQENVRESLGISTPGQFFVPEVRDCETCEGEGYYRPKEDVRGQRVTLFWERTECKCGERYEAPAFGNSVLIRNEIYRPIVRQGKLFGWRYHRIEYRPCEDLSLYSDIPFEIEWKYQKTQHCRKCIRDYSVIRLPHVED